MSDGARHEVDDLDIELPARSTGTVEDSMPPGAGRRPHLDDSPHEVHLSTQG
jgi:hypothetical protein